jgi:NADH-quinone oxidoreductase subunit N
MAVGFCFKVSTVPFHTWTPDVYVGAPTTITAFMSVGTKVAAFVALARVFLLALYPQHAYWQPIFWAVAILSMVVGNFLAVTQTDVKRMLAYSSVAHAGYIMVGIATGTVLGFSAVLVYLATYAVMNLGAFGVVLVLERRNGTGTTLGDYAGLARRQPVLAAVMLICMLSLAGVPPSAGFVGKWDVFYAAIVGGHLELAIVGILASVLGMFYYLRVIWAMYFVEPATVPVPAAASPVLAPQPALVAVAVASGSAGAGAMAVATAAGAGPAPSALAPIAHPPHNPPVGSTVESWVALTIATVLTLLLGIIPGPLFVFAIQVATVFVR